jgi:hypothetical protein
MTPTQTLTGVIAAVGLATTLHAQPIDPARPTPPEGQGLRAFHPDAHILTAEASK